MFLRFINRFILLVLWPIYLVTFVVVFFFQELYRAWKNFGYWDCVKHEFQSSNRAFSRDFKKGRLTRSKEEIEAAKKAALDDL